MQEIAIWGQFESWVYKGKSSGPKLGFSLIRRLTGRPTGRTLDWFFKYVLKVEPFFCKSVVARSGRSKMTHKCKAAGPTFFDSVLCFVLQYLPYGGWSPSAKLIFFKDIPIFVLCFLKCFGVEYGRDLVTFSIIPEMFQKVLHSIRNH